MNSPVEPNEEKIEEAIEENTGFDDPISTIERERDDMRALAQRTQADFVNYKRRMEDERSWLIRNANTQLLAKLLPVVDDLRRAVTAIPEEAPAPWSQGVELILQNMDALIASEGISVFEPSGGEQFDPSIHEALYYDENDQHPAGTIIDTIHAGYRSPDRVIRPAQVVVAKEKATESEEKTNDETPS